MELKQPFINGWPSGSRNALKTPCWCWKNLSDDKKNTHEMRGACELEFSAKSGKCRRNVGMAQKIHGESKGIFWVVPPPSNSGKWRFIYRDPLLKMVHNPGGGWHPGRMHKSMHITLPNATPPHKNKTLTRGRKVGGLPFAGGKKK